MISGHHSYTVVMRQLAMVTPLLLPACVAGNGPEVCRIAKVVEIPIRIVDSVPVVDVHIAGRPVHLLLDTRADGNLISEEAFARLGLERDYLNETYGVGLGAQTGHGPSKPVEVMLGTFTLSPAPLYVAPIAWRSESGEVTDGVLGSGSLSAFDVDIDMVQGRLTLYEPRRCPNGPPPFGGSSMTLHATPNGVHRLTVPVTVNGRELPAIVDTGTTRTLVDARQAGLKPADLQNDSAGRAITPDPVGLVVFSHRFDSLKVGREVLTNPVLSVAQIPRPGISVILASDYWQNRRVWISYSGRTVTVGPPQAMPR